MNRLMKLTLVVALAVGLAVILVPRAWAFHDGGVAHCNGCHTMHNSENGALVDPDSPTGNDHLLIDATPSDTCLDCHGHSGASYGVLSADPLAPDQGAAGHGGGDFVFLLEDNLNDGHAGASSPIPGDAAGHNLNAPGHGLSSDPTPGMGTSPGGTFPSSQLACSSCHDPHGNAGFRMLYTTGAVVSGVTFTNAQPTADSLAVFGPAEDATHHTAFKSGMSGWCGNCHGAFHNTVGTNKHPTNQNLGATIATKYGLYNGTDDTAGGAPATSYLPEVPFEDPANTTTSTAGPSGTSVVACITCHRAHASSAPNAGRWDFSVTFLEEDGAESGSYALPNPYVSLNGQRSLCNKCHVWDGDDELVLDADL